MAIGFDSATGLGSGTGTLSVTHVPVGTPTAAILFVVNADSIDAVNAATYGGVPMTQIVGSPLILAGGEKGVVHAFLLGSGVPSGAQTVQVTAADARVKAGVVMTITGGPVEAQDTDTSIAGSGQANPTVTLALGGKECFCALAFLSGQDALRDIAPLANWTRVVEHDLGSQVAGFYRYNTIGTLDVTAGWTQSPADAVMIALAIRLAAATGGAGTAGMAETNDTIWARGVAARNGGASMAVAGNSPAARGALTLKAMTALVGTSNAAVASAILPVAGTLGAVEARDMVSSAGGTRATAALGATLADVSLAADGAAAIAGRSTIILADAKMSASAAKPAVILRRAGSDGSDEFERHQREWRQDLRRVIDDAFGIAGSLVDPDMPGPPPDFAGLAGALHLRRQAMEQETVELLLAEEARRQEEDAMAILLLAA